MKIIFLFLTVIIFIAGGCSSAQSQATFRNHNIVIGQSNETVENLLGPPDWANGGQINHYGFLAYKIDPWWHPGRFTIEWGYWDNPKTLILWFEGNAVQAIWLADTNKLR